MKKEQHVLQSAVYGGSAPASGRSVAFQATCKSKLSTQLPLGKQQASVSVTDVWLALFTVQTVPSLRSRSLFNISKCSDALLFTAS